MLPILFKKMETINNKMHVLKRNGKSEEMSFDKIKSDCVIVTSLKQKFYF